MLPCLFTAVQSSFCRKADVVVMNLISVYKEFLGWAFCFIINIEKSRTEVGVNSCQIYCSIEKVSVPLVLNFRAY